MAELKNREDIPQKDKWCLEHIFPNKEAWQAELDELIADTPSMEQYRGKLDNYETVKEMLYEEDRLSHMAERLFVYARMNRDTDNANAEYNDMVGKAMNAIIRLEELTSYIMPELSKIDSATLEAWAQKEEMYPFDFSLREISRNKPHVLSDAEERILALAGEVGNSYDDIFTMLCDVDMTFAPVVKDGEELPMSHGRYGLYLEDEDREVRKQAYVSNYEAYKKQINTLAALYSSSVKKDVFFAKSRHYDSARASSLFGGAIPEAVYDSLISAVHDALPVMHDYVALRAKALDLPDLAMYDMYVPMISAIESKTPFEKGKELVLEALKPLGSQYCKVLASAFEDGWIDIYETKGKSSGAYSWGPYGTHPYVLLNYQDRLDDAFTLAHEMGHAMHSYHSDAALPFSKAGYRTFVAEVASTVNEVLLLHYLLDNTDDVQMKKYLLELHLEQFRTTLFRQTMFAEFEYLTHTQAEKGESLSKDWLCTTYADLNKKYYGDAVDTDEYISYEWSRIPHFYRAFYVYQYATGFSAAVAIAGKILSEGQSAAEKYLTFLSSGGSDHPIELLKLAGIDMSKPDTVKAALDSFKDTLEQLKSLM
ncbi:MAG: oligoendopeptidase F [Clostridia bacterium]|nr:oligoendopeptidase F [Clostridia bacterium]